MIFATHQQKFVCEYAVLIGKKMKGKYSFGLNIDKQIAELRGAWVSVLIVYT